MLAYELVKDDLQHVEALMLQEMRSEVPLAELVMHYTLKQGGKRFRPVLSLLSSKICHTNQEKAYLAAAFIEFIHSATLLHDDVVDESELRRGQQAAHIVFGNAASVLVGDFLYTRAFQLMVRSACFPVIETMADAVNLIAAGEVMQLSNVRNPDIDEKTYYRVIELKTAVLFSAACQTAAQLANATPEQVEALKNYGKKLGMAFQIADDWLDYRGDTQELGKALGDDLAEGKPTLLLIRALQQLPSEENKRLREIISNGEREALPEVLKLLEKTDAWDFTFAAAEKLAQEAINHLAIFPESEAKSALIELTEYALRRQK